jgi:hypothetical protein
MKNNGIILAIGAFVLTLGIFLVFYYGSSGSSEAVLQFKNPAKIEAQGELAYSLDNVDGTAKDLTFRCNPKTGEGYFSLKSKNYTWVSSHCQDMVGAVTEIEEGKQPVVILKLSESNNKVFYQVQRNQGLK